ncbi:metallophosphoesterase family protein [Mucilaginibacter sp.]
MKTKENPTQKHSTGEVLRFAHPFFTPTPIEQRDVVEGIGTRMTDYIQTQLLPIPAPLRNPTMMLSEIIGDAGVNEIEQTGTLIFHTVGDTGIETGTTQQLVADAMSSDYNTAEPASSPAFFFHLGDVDYYDNTDKGYHAQFYEPYKTYPGKIIAIPGNHDGELFKYDGTSTGQKVTLGEFQANFCQAVTGVPPAAGTIYREMISQPAVYWCLNTPFADIIGLYSNVAENPGYISGPTIGTAQKDWLTQTLQAIATARKSGPRKALIIATHHPPFSSGSHSSSTDMLIDIDDSCTQAEIFPDAFLSGHSHNIQCYTRYITINKKDLQVPYVILGCGGRPVTHVPSATGAKITDATKIPSSHTFDKSLSTYGYGTITVTPNKLIIDITTVDSTGTKNLFDSISVDLQ